MTSKAILTDVTRCIGCEQCVEACRRTNGTGPDAPYRWQPGATGLSAERWTTLATAPNGRFVRLQCRHCLDPSCVAACPVGALQLTGEGAVVYDAEICMGCRYCLVACPFGMTRYEWISPTPRVRKCIMCYHKIASGAVTEPACTAACPNQATVCGGRDQLLDEARRRIREHPGTYIDHIWGEHEVGGTSVLYISDVDLATADWPPGMDDVARPALARGVLHTVPYTFIGVAAVMYGIHWTFERRQAVAMVETAPASDTQPPPETPEEGEPQ